MKKIVIFLLTLLIFIPTFSVGAATLASKLKGYILLQVEEHGEAWYVNPTNEKRYYMKDGAAAYQMLRNFGLGITNADLAKIPVGIEERFKDTDTDNDGLADRLEEGLGTDINNLDTDNDGHSDGEEVRTGYNPLGAGKTLVDSGLVIRLKGRILLQVQKSGQAWYINPKDGKRYYMRDGDAAYQIMRFLSLGITNKDLNTIISDSISGNNTVPSPTCSSGYHLENSSCVANIQSCPVANGIGQKVWNGINWGNCLAISCNNYFVNINGICESEKEIDMLIFISPQYKNDSQITSAVNNYITAVENDIGWKTEIIKLDQSSNTIGKIRMTIKNYYSQYGLKSALMIGEDIKTALGGEFGNEENPSTIIWEELNQSFSYSLMVWDGSKWNEINPSSRGLIKPENTTAEVDQILQRSDGKQVQLIGADWLKPEVFVSLLYPPKEYSYQERVNKIIFALNKFSQQRDKNYNGITQVFKWDFGGDGFDFDAFKKLGNYNRVNDCNPCNFNLNQEYKLFIADGHADPQAVQVTPYINTGYSHSIGYDILQHLKTPFYIAHGCYINGWYSTANPNGLLDQPGRDLGFMQVDITMEQIFTSDYLRTMMLGVGDGNTVSYSDFVSSLLSGKTVAEAYTSGKRSLSHVFYGDPTFHYNF